MRQGNNLDFKIADGEYKSLYFTVTLGIYETGINEIVNIPEKYYFARLHF